jgi:hypothetical protein
MGFPSFDVRLVVPWSPPCDDRLSFGRASPQSISTGEFGRGPGALGTGMQAAP